MASSDLILALDIGTSSIKTALFTLSARRVEKTTAHETYALHVAADGKAELAVDDLEQAAVRALRRTLATRRRDPSLKNRAIVAVGTSCFWHSLLGWNAKRKKPTAIFTWADARCGNEAARLRREMHESAYHRRTGCMLRTPYWPAKLRWLHRTEKTRGMIWMSPAEWLYGGLCGAATISTSMASGTGLMNARTGAWDGPLLQLCGVTERMLPSIADEPLHPVTPEAGSLPALARFPELQQAAWYPALGDGAASNLGSDACTPHVAALNVGTSAALRLVFPVAPARLDRGLFCYRVDADRSLIGGAISNAGNLRAWALQELRIEDDPATLERALARRQFPHPGLTVLPFWTGERAPSWPEAVGGAISGINYSTTALDLLQALTESTYHRLAQIADLLARQTAPHQLAITVSGGIRHSPESLQRLANVLGRPVRACPEPEASLRGAAVHVIERLGGSPTSLRPGRIYSPHRAAARAYASQRELQVALERKLEG